MPTYRRTAIVEAIVLEEDTVVPSKEGDHQGYKGDYLCTGIDGEQWVVKKDIFERTYKLVSDDEIRASTELSASEYWDMSNEIDSLIATVRRLVKELEHYKNRCDELIKKVISLRPPETDNRESEFPPTILEDVEIGHNNKSILLTGSLRIHFHGVARPFLYTHVFRLGEKAAAEKVVNLFSESETKPQHLKLYFSSDGLISDVAAITDE